MIAHVGNENTRVFRETAKLGKELESFGNKTLGSKNPSKVGIIFDWDNYWALEYTSGPSEDLKYVDQIHQYYKFFYKQNISVDMIPGDADFSRYDIIAAPVLYMIRDGMKEALEDFVKNGGTLITTFMSGIVGQSDNVYLGGYPARCVKWQASGSRRSTPLPQSRKTLLSLTITPAFPVECSVTSSISKAQAPWLPMGMTSMQVCRVLQKITTEKVMYTTSAAS